MAAKPTGRHRTKDLLGLRKGVTVDTTACPRPDTGTSPRDLRRWFRARCKAAAKKGGQLEDWLTLMEAAALLERSPRETVLLMEWRDRRDGTAIFDRGHCTVVLADAVRRELERVAAAKSRVAWAFSDDTVVRPGGSVEGRSPFAEELREALARPPVTWSVGYMPSRETECVLDRDDLESLDSWLSRVSEPYRRDCGMLVLERPASESEWTPLFSANALVMDPPPIFHLTAEQAAKVAAYVRDGGVF